MRQKRNIARSSPTTAAKAARLELSPDRAFVLHLSARARLPRQVVGRVEHVTSGQVAHVTCLRELVEFMAKVLRNRVRDERRRVNASFAQEPCQSELEAGARGSLVNDAAPAAKPIRRGRKRGAES